MINAERYHELLRLNRLKQRDLARTVGVGEVAMSRYGSGARCPKPEMIAKIALALGTSSEYLCGTDGMMKPDESFAMVRGLVMSYAREWSQEEKKLLLLAIAEKI